MNGSPYLLRIITRKDAVNDPTRQFACMQSGAAMVIAPRVPYASIPDDRGAGTHPAHAAAPCTRCRRFPDSLNCDTLNGFVGKFLAANILPKGETDDVFARYARVAAVYPRDDSDMVSSHNDLKPENMLFDGQRLWLVDWEAQAYRCTCSSRPDLVGRDQPGERGDAVESDLRPAPACGGDPAALRGGFVGRLTTGSPRRGGRCWRGLRP